VSSVRRFAAALPLFAVAVTGCGLGPGKDEGDVTLTVTRDNGTEVMLEKTDSIRESDTVIRLLDRNADITTRYGGGFIQSIDGLAGGTSGGHRSDWFFYVNGIESSIGAAEVQVHGGDRVWWDYREWTAAMRVPAVVGSWPEPFAHGLEGKRFPARIDCLGAEESCSAVADRLEAEGVPASIGTAAARSEGELLRVVVGTWDEVSADSAAALIDDGPATSGVFADFEPAGDGGHQLVALDSRGEEATRAGGGTGLVAAVREGEEQPTWIVTGTDQAGVDAAVELLDEDSLRDHYAVANAGGEELALPVVP
jgi:hypothetical protein